MLKIIKRNGREKGAEENKSHGGYNTMKLYHKLLVAIILIIGATLILAPTVHAMQVLHIWFSI